MIRRSGPGNLSTRPTARRLSAAPRLVRARAARAGFTLIELLITISIIGIMASMILFALFSAQEQAKVQKTRALIMRLDSIIRTRYESYRTRRVPVTPGPGENPAKLKLDCLRDLMRMEMPDRWWDVIDLPATPLNRVTKMSAPSTYQAYRNRWSAVTGQAGTLTIDPNKLDNQGAECLYMIVMEAVTQEGDSRDVFKADQFGDTDNDGFPEFIDAWGVPIYFFRWAPGFMSDLQVVLRADMTAMSMGQSCTVTTNVPVNSGSKFSTATGYYVGGTLAANRERRDPRDQMARITGYSRHRGHREFHMRHAEHHDADPLRHGPGGSYDFAVMMPDPFDYRGVYPIYNPGSVRRRFPIPRCRAMPSIQ